MLYKYSILSIYYTNGCLNNVQTMHIQKLLCQLNVMLMYNCILRIEIRITLDWVMLLFLVRASKPVYGYINV